jgi:hypothetical protein
MAALATIQDLEATLGRTLVGDPDRVARVERVLEMASAVVREYTGQFFELVADDEVVLFPDNDGWYRLPQRPIVDVTAIADQDAVDLFTTYAFDTDGWFRNFPMYPQAARPRWPFSSLSVTYSHGYAEIPADVVMVVCSMAGRSWSNPAGIRSESVGDYSVTYAIPGTGESIGLALSRPEMDVLRSYRWPSV